jgi:hypothetical protein
LRSRASADHLRLGLEATIDELLRGERIKGRHGRVAVDAGDVSRTCSRQNFSRKPKQNVVDRQP